MAIYLRGLSYEVKGMRDVAPSPLVLKAGSHVVDVAFGAQTPTTLNLTDAEFGDEYYEQLYIVDTPAQYDGPLKFPSTAKGSVRAAGKAVNGIHAAKKAGVPGDALVDMLGEVDLAMRATLGVYEDLSLTARNDAEARLMLAMQGCPANYHKHPGVHQIYENAESVFSGVAPGTFVGPDGLCYGAPYVARWREGISAETRDWMSVAKMLELISGWSVYMGPSGGDSGPAGWLERTLGAIGDMIVSTAHAQGRRLGGSRGQFARRGGLKTPKRGAGSNPRRRPVGRNGSRAHTQTHSRRPVKSNRKIKFRGAKFSSKDAHNHFFNGEGVRTNGTFNGGHTTTTYARDVAASGARPLGSAPHPRVRGVYENRYQPRKQAGSQGPGGVRMGGRFGKAETKTVVDTAIRSARQVMRDMKQALRNGMMRPKFQPNAPYQTFNGYTKSGVKIKFHVSGHGNGSYTVRSYYYVF